MLDKTIITDNLRKELLDTGLFIEVQSSLRDDGRLFIHLRLIGSIYSLYLRSHYYNTWYLNFHSPHDESLTFEYVFDNSPRAVQAKMIYHLNLLKNIKIK